MLRKNILFSLLIFSLCYCANLNAAEIYLEGINIIGSQKKAFVLIDNTKIMVQEGDVVSGWVVETINPRKLLIKSTDGSLERELELHRTANIPGINPGAASSPKAAKQETTTTDNTDEPAVIAPPPPKEISKGVYQGRPRFIPDEEVPAGYIKKRTPFGDFLIKEKKP